MIFEENDVEVVRDQRPNKSSQINSKYSDVVPINNENHVNTREDDNPIEDPFFDKISQTFHRIKRRAASLFDWRLPQLSDFIEIPTSPPLASNSIVTTVTDTARTKRDTDEPFKA